MKADIDTAIDRDETISRMEPLLIGDSSRQRASLTVLAVELARRKAPDSGALCRKA